MCVRFAELVHRPMAQYSILAYANVCRDVVYIRLNVHLKMAACVQVHKSILSVLTVMLVLLVAVLLLFVIAVVVIVVVVVVVKC